MAGQLEGKVAFITGAASGIGRGTVDVFVEEGAHVVVGDIQDEKGPEIEKAHPGKVKYVRCDVTKEEDIACAIETALSANITETPAPFGITVGRGGEDR